MATLRDIRRRITSVKSTQQITRAMKLVAAAKLRRAQERILEARPYSYKMGEVLSDLALRSPRELHPLLVTREPRENETGSRKMLMVISGDRGLCGAFNSNIIRRSVDFLRGYQADPEITLTLMVVGRKVRDYYRRRGQYTVRSEYANFFDKLAYSHAAQIAQDLIRSYVEEEVDEVHLLYNEFKSVATQRVVVEQLLPIQPSSATKFKVGSRSARIAEACSSALLSCADNAWMSARCASALCTAASASGGASLAGSKESVSTSAVLAGRFSARTRLSLARSKALRAATICAFTAASCASARVTSRRTPVPLSSCCLAMPTSSCARTTSARRFA